MPSSPSGGGTGRPDDPAAQRARDTEEYLRLVLDPLPKRVERWVNASLIVTGLIPILFIAYLLGSLALTGGDLKPHSSPMWGSLLDYPLFPMPLITCFTLAAASIAALIVQLAMHASLPSRVWMGFLRVNLAAGLTTVGFAFFVPDHSITGEPPAGASELAAIGDQWFAAIVFLVVAVIVTIVSFVKDAAERRLAPPPMATEDFPSELRRTQLLSSAQPPSVTPRRRRRRPSFRSSRR